MIKIIHPNGKTVDKAILGKPALNVLKIWIGCVNIEIVIIWHKGQYEQLIIDEIGRLEGKCLNPIATEIYLENTKVHDPAMYKDALQNPIANILGTAVLLTGNNKLT